jgi:hypothetical protein
MTQRLPTLGATAVVLLALAGCGSGQDTATVKPSDGQSSQAVASAPRTKLTITVRQSPSAKPRTWTLTCGPTGGDLPHAEAACAVLARAAASRTDPFAPTPKGQMCTMIYSGPQTAKVTGTWNGRKIDSSFNRKNGCETKRWNTLSALFGSPS